MYFVFIFMIVNNNYFSAFYRSIASENLFEYLSLLSKNNRKRRLSHIFTDKTRGRAVKTVMTLFLKGFWIWWHWFNLDIEHRKKQRLSYQYNYRSISVMYLTWAYIRQISFLHNLLTVLLFPNLKNGNPMAFQSREYTIISFFHCCLLGET